MKLKNLLKLKIIGNRKNSPLKNAGLVLCLNLKKQNLILINTDTDYIYYGYGAKAGINSNGNREHISVNNWGIGSAVAQYDLIIIEENKDFFTKEDLDFIKKEEEKILKYLQHPNNKSERKHFYRK